MTKIDINPLEKLISVHLGVSELDIQSDIYSEWKRWMIISDNSKYPQAFRCVGGDPLTPTKNLGTTYFIMNGWKIKPPEEDSTLNIIGNFYDDDGGSPLTKAIGHFNSVVTLTVSNLTDSQVVTSTIAESLDYQGIVYYDQLSSFAGNYYPVGTVNMPVNNLNDCVAICERIGSRIISIRGELYINQNMTDYTFKGKNSSSSLFSNGYDLSDCVFDNLYLTGNNFGKIRANSCLIENATNLFGEFNQCALAGVIRLANEDSCFVLCFTKNGIDAYTVIDFTDCVSNDSCFRAYTGSLYLSNAKAIELKVEIDYISGSTIVDANCENSSIIIRGVSSLINHSSIVINDSTIINNNSISSNVWNTNIATYSNPETFGGFLKGKVLTVAKFIGLQ